MTDAKIKLPQHSLYLLASVIHGPKCNFNGLVTGVEVCIYRTLPHSITRREFDEFSDEWIEDLSHVKQSQLFEDNARKSGPQEALFASLDDADMLKSIPVLFDCMQTPFDFRIVQPEVSDLADGYNLVEAFTGREDMPQNSDKDIVGKLLLNLPAHRVSKLYTTAFGDAFDYYLMDPDYLHAPAIVHIHQFPTALTSLHICWDHHDHYMFFRDWVDFLKCTPSLQTLRLQDAGCSSSEILIQHVLTETLLPSLNKLILQDLEFEPTDLFVFIKDNKESLRNLKLIGSCFRHSDEVRKFLVFYTRRAYLDRRLSWTITEYENCWDPGFLHEFCEHIKICSDDDIEGQLRDVGGWVNHVPGRDNW